MSDKYPLSPNYLVLSVHPVKNVDPTELGRCRTLEEAQQERRDYIDTGEYRSIAIYRLVGESFNLPQEASE